MSTSILKPPRRKFWLCRAEKGIYYDHFKAFGVMAMGHFDKIKNLDTTYTREQLSSSLRAVMTLDPTIEDRTANNHINQAMHFIYDAAIGDIVLTVNSTRIAIGVITSHAYFEKESLILLSNSPEDEDIPMRYYLRREVDWITSVRRSSLPYSLSRGVRGNQTFFSLDDYEDEIYSIVSTFVYKNESLSMNLLITKEENISTYDYSLLTNTILKCEFLAKELPHLKTVTSISDIQERFTTFCISRQTQSHLKAEFASPGRTSVSVSIVLVSAGVFAFLISSALSGGKINVELGSIVKVQAESNGLLTNDVAGYILKNTSDLSLKVISQWLLKESPQSLKQNLQLKKPGANVDLRKLETKRIAKNDTPKE